MLHAYEQHIVPSSQHLISELWIGQGGAATSALSEMHIFFIETRTNNSTGVFSPWKKLLTPLLPNLGKTLICKLVPLEAVS